MTVAAILKKMIDYSQGNLHDIEHLMKVWGFARAIGVLEGLDEETQFLLEVAAIVHDIACPLCREKYGNTAGPNQEREGAVLARDFLGDTGLTQAQIDRVVYLVGRHHTFKDMDGPDYQILVEADYIVNAAESGYRPGSIRTFRDKVFKIAAGIALLESMYPEGQAAVGD